MENLRRGFALLSAIGTIWFLIQSFQSIPFAAGCIAEQCLTVHPTILVLLLGGLAFSLGLETVRKLWRKYQRSRPKNRFYGLRHTLEDAHSRLVYSMYDSPADCWKNIERIRIRLYELDIPCPDVAPSIDEEKWARFLVVLTLLAEIKDVDGARNVLKALEEPSSG